LLFYKDTPPTDIYPLSLPDALPIWAAAAAINPNAATSTNPQAEMRICFSFAGRMISESRHPVPEMRGFYPADFDRSRRRRTRVRSEEHTSELQSPYDLVCRLLLEKK